MSVFNGTVHFINIEIILQCFASAFSKAHDKHGLLREAQYVFLVRLTQIN